MNLHKNASLIIGLTIPVLLCIAIIASIYIPRLSAPQPEYSFLYSSNDHFYSTYRYTVNQGKFVREKIQQDAEFIKNNNPIEPTFFVYNPVNDESTELSFEEAEKLNLNSNRESPDGYTLEQGGGEAFPFYFGNSNSNTWFLTGHNTSYKVELRQLGQYPTIQFYGWIVK